MLTAREIRKKYLDFFERKQHHIAKSGPLVPEGDPSLLFTNAGMVQFKKYFLGDPDKPFSRAATCQKCLRVSGKHNDLENVGRTARHHTFFEMLGNFSFGDYFKKEAIAWAWEFVTTELGLPKDKLWVTIYNDDDEAARIWHEVAGLPEERIVRMGEKDNFWTMGDTGPCGPCSEIYIDQGEEMACGPNCGIGKCDCDRFLEIWNLVFTQFDQNADGSRSQLAAPNIDTGMGLERIAAVCQGKKSNFDCDLFQEIIQHAAQLAGVTYSYSAPDTNEIDTALRVIADHGRAAAFLIAEGILPSNESRGYVLRRLIRRALRFATLMGIKEPFLHHVAKKVTAVMGDAYPELLEKADFISRVVYEEEKRFAQTLEHGLGMLDEELGKLQQAGQTVIPGSLAFKLYDTYGFPIDIVSDIAEKRGFEVDLDSYNKLMLIQRERARENRKNADKQQETSLQKLGEFCEVVAASGEKSVFVGYETLETKSGILALFDFAGNPVNQLETGHKGFLIAGQTPFYAESGGQVADSGFIESDHGNARVLKVLKSGSNINIHEIEMLSGNLKKGEQVLLKVENNRRRQVAANHTCTHLLHAALRRVLGNHVRQAGSLVDEQRLRFDFSHLSALSQEELAEVERQVNSAIFANLPVCAAVMAKDEATAKGAMALFSEKYGNEVRVLTIGDNDNPESIELCGGTHLSHTGEAGLFLIVSETGVAAGIRRIEAVCGWNAYNLAIHYRSEVRDVAKLLKTAPDNLREKATALQNEIKSLRKAAPLAAAAEIAPVDLSTKAKKIASIDLIAEVVPHASLKSLRDLMDKLRGKYANKAIICLVGEDKGKAAMLLHVSRDLHDHVTAPQLIKQLTPLFGGGGGGRPDLAQSGGGDMEQTRPTLALLEEMVTGLAENIK